ncbi:MAG: HEAT repeat domain-containing protein, partial [Anaerolineaceae bacterium]|nr:HEAT repeat domain-containing protein [Anaerolineaceae bacterium]
GRSLDPDWEKHILANVDSRDTDVQLEAVRAAGHLELDSSRKPLLDLLEESEIIDEEVRAAVIWSLSQVGGESVKEALEDLLEKTEDQDEASLIEDALDNLEFTEGFPGLELFNIGLDDELETGLDIDLEDEDEADENNPRPES